MLRRLLQAPNLIAGRDPARHGVEQPKPSEVIATGNRGGLHRLASISPGGGVQQLGVGRQPATERLGPTHLKAKIGEITINHALKISVQQAAPQARRSPHDPGKPTADDCLGIVTHRVAGMTVDLGMPRYFLCDPFGGMLGGDGLLGPA